MEPRWYWKIRANLGSASGGGRGGRGRGRGGAVAALEARIQAIETASLAGGAQISEVTTDQTNATNANQTGAGSGFGRGLHQRGRGGRS